jgi:23S rRNA (cytidine1920-2'-O)/16S rRNA (cytidine1409-2'-O)-methyltransferase
MSRAAKSRLDVYLVNKGLASDVKEAQALVLAGQIRVNGHAGKAGQLVGPEDVIEAAEKSRFASRGGEKLDGALNALEVPVKGRVCLDVGASTGGFTDCLLQRGAASVWAVDVGHGLLDARLRSDARVHLLEETNFRTFDTALVSEPVSLLTADVSFISLGKLLGKMAEVLSEGGDAVVLVKPQFEGTPKEVPGGFVRDEETRQAILERMRAAAEASGFVVKKVVDSSIKGLRKGNQESFFHLIKPI